MPLNQPVTFLEGHWTNILTWDMMIRRSTCGWVTQIMSVKPSVKQQLTNKGTLWFLTIGFDTAQKISSLQGRPDEPDENGLACHKGGAVTDWQLPAHSLLTLAMTRVTLLCKSNRDQREREKYFPKQLLSGLAIKTCYFMPTARRSNSELGPLGCPPIQHCAIYKWTIMAAFKREWLAEIDWRKRGGHKICGHCTMQLSHCKNGY